MRNQGDQSLLGNQGIRTTSPPAMYGWKLLTVLATGAAFAALFVALFYTPSHHHAYPTPTPSPSPSPSHSYVAGEGIIFTPVNDTSDVISSPINSTDPRTLISYSDPDSDGSSEAVISPGNVFASFGFSTLDDSTIPGTAVEILSNSMLFAYLYTPVSLQNTIETYSALGTGFTLSGDSIQITASGRHQYVIAWQALVEATSMSINRACGYIGVDDIPDGAGSGLDYVYSLTCALEDSDTYINVAGSATVSLTGNHTIQLRMSNNSGGAKRGVIPADVIFARVDIALV